VVKYIRLLFVVATAEGGCGPKSSFLVFTRLEAGYLHFAIAQHAFPGYGHERLMAARTQDLELPPLEDANAIVLSLTKGLNAMMKGQMDLKSAGMFFYGMQIVASVMGRVRFGEPEENLTADKR
jgi:hypothetical protein